LEARTEHEIRAVLENWREHRRNHLRPVATVAIKEQEDVGSWINHGKARHHRAAIASPCLKRHAGTRVSCALRGAVARASVDDDDLANALTANRFDDGADRGFLVEAGNHYRRFVGHAGG